MTAGIGDWRRLDRYLLSRPEPALAAWAADRLWPAHGRRERWLRAGARRAPGLAAGLLRRPDAPDLEAGAAVESVLASPPPGAGALAGVVAWVLALPHDEDRRGRLTAFLFPGGADTRRPVPDRLLKLRPESAGGPGLATEGEVLSRLARELPAELARTVPALLGSGRAPVGADGRDGGPRPGWEVLALSALPGRSAYVELQGAFAPAPRAPGHLAAALRWLVRFRESTARSGECWSLPPWEELDPGAAEEGGAGARRPDWHRRLEDRLAASPVSSAPVHGDFWARNLLVADGAPGTDREGLPGVVDWEHFRPDGFPFQDLFTFATTYALSYPWGGRRRPAPEALERAFLRRSPLSRALREAFCRYGRAADRGVDALGGLFRVFLLEGARRSPDPSAWLGLYRRLEGGERSVFSG